MRERKTASNMTSCSSVNERNLLSGALACSRRCQQFPRAGTRHNDPAFAGEVNRPRRPPRVHPLGDRNRHHPFSVRGQKRRRVGICWQGCCATTRARSATARNVRPAVFIRSKRLNVLLKDFRSNRNHIAIVGRVRRRRRAGAIEDVGGTDRWRNRGRIRSTRPKPHRSGPQCVRVKAQTGSNAQKDFRHRLLQRISTTGRPGLDHWAAAKRGGSSHGDELKGGGDDNGDCIRFCRKVRRSRPELSDGRGQAPVYFVGSTLPAPFLLGRHVADSRRDLYTLPIRR